MGTQVEQSGELLPRAGRARRRHLEDMADSLHRLPSAAEDLYVIVPSRNRALLLQGEFCITLQLSAGREPTCPSTGILACPLSLLPVRVRDIQVIVDGRRRRRNAAERRLVSAVREVHDQLRVIWQGEGRAVGNEQHRGAMTVSGYHRLHRLPGNTVE